MQNHTTDKTRLGYNKQTTFSKKTNCASCKKVNPNKVSKKKTMVFSKPKAMTCHYCMKKDTQIINAMLGDLMYLEVNVLGFLKI